MKKNGDFDIGWRSCVKQVIFYCCVVGCIPLFSTQVCAQQTMKQENPQKLVTYSGTVKDKAGSVLPGVTIILEGTNRGVTTDAQGEFSISIPEMPRVKLVFSFIGMKTKVVVVEDRQPLQVIMEEQWMKWS